MNRTCLYYFSSYSFVILGLFKFKKYAILQRTKSMCIIANLCICMVTRSTNTYARYQYTTKPFLDSDVRSRVNKNKHPVNLIG